MATRKNTQAKTKTSARTKRNTTRAAASSRNARSRKVSARPNTRRAAATQVSPRRMLNFQSLRQKVFALGNLLGVGGALLALLAIAAGVMMQHVSFPVTLTHLTSDSLLSQKSTVFVPASHALFDIELRWVVVALLVSSLVLPVLYLTRLKNFYAERIARRRVIGLRWIDLAISSALMMEVIALLCGYTDIMVLKMIGALMAVTCALGWLAEKQNETAPRPVWDAFTISLFTGALPWVAIGGAKLGTLLFGEVRSPWYVYAVCISTLVGFCLLGFNQLNQHRRLRRWADYAFVERNYVLINLANKVAFALILIIGLSK